MMKQGSDGTILKSVEDRCVVVKSDEKKFEGEEPPFMPGETLALEPLAGIVGQWKEGDIVEVCVQALPCSTS